jgi:hypothetical protein
MLYPLSYGGSLIRLTTLSGYRNSQPAPDRVGNASISGALCGRTVDARNVVNHWESLGNKALAFEPLKGLYYKGKLSIYKGFRPVKNIPLHCRVTV